MLVFSSNQERCGREAKTEEKKNPFWKISGDVSTVRSKNRSNLQDQEYTQFHPVCSRLRNNLIEVHLMKSFNI